MAKNSFRLETLIIIVFLLTVTLWAISQCSESRREHPRAERTEEEDLQLRERTSMKRETIYVPQPTAPAPADNYTAPAANTPAPASSSPPPRRPALAQEPTPAPAAATYSTLYVTIDGLNLRKEPNRHSAVVTRLKLYEPVLFLNRKSEQPEEVNLGREKVTDYWVNVRTQNGKEGWVFGAGVHYYQTKRPGVE